MTTATQTKQLVADPGSIAGIAQAITEGKTDPRGVLDNCLRRIEAAEPLVQGWCLIDRDAALTQVDVLRAEAAVGRMRGPLFGIPVAIKDVIDVAGWPTRAGSATRAQAPPCSIDAQVVTQLRTAGAVILGKAHTTELAYFDGPPPTRNPHNLDHTPGGSSAGPAAVVAAGMVPLSLGTQTAGSVSRPAAYCGIAAFKPSTRAWSTFGVVPFAPSFDTVGVFGYRVKDATAGARALMPPFLRKPSARSEPDEDLRLAFVHERLRETASAAVSWALHTATDKLAATGAHVERRASPVRFADLIARHETIIEYEVARAHAGLAGADEGMVTPALRDAVVRGAKIGDVAYRDACRAIESAREQFWAAMKSFHALIFPAAPDVAPAGMKTGDPRFIIPFTALGGPIVSVPVGFDAGLPIGLMLIGAPGSDAALADIGDRLAPAIEVGR
jgi:aspartyl-tRNA(Asn)/glutamyl-tRNA(Gln) amidotransferase subunit A